MGAIVRSATGKTPGWKSAGQSRTCPRMTWPPRLNRGYLSIPPAVGRRGVAFQFLKEEEGLQAPRREGLGEDMTVGPGRRGAPGRTALPGKPHGFRRHRREIFRFPLRGRRPDAVQGGSLRRRHSAQKITCTDQSLDPAVDPALFGGASERGTHRRIEKPSGPRAWTAGSLRFPQAGSSGYRVLDLTAEG
jgi:hypothetical protein